MGNRANNFIKTLDRNLPTILTGISVVTGIASTAYAVYAGYKTAKEMEEIPEDATTVEKIKKIAPKFIPVAAGVIVSSGCAIAANHENGKRYAALAATLAATRIDTAKVQAKAEEILGKEKAEEVKQEISKDKDARDAYARLIADADKRMAFHDLETGYVFRSTLNDFLFAQRTLNDRIESMNEGSISDLYSSMLGDEYVEASIHNDVVFGRNLEVKYFNPSLDVELGPDLQPVYSLSYSYSSPNELRDY